MTLELPPHIVYHDLLDVLKECRSDSKIVVSLSFLFLDFVLFPIGF